MSKTAILLAVVLVLGLSLAAYPIAHKVDFVQTTDCTSVDGEVHANLSGFVVVNPTPKSPTEYEIQIQVRGGAPSHEYAVYSNYMFLGAFTTDEEGSGHLHIHFNELDQPPYKPLGRITVWNKVKESPPNSLIDYPLLHGTWK